MESVKRSRKLVFRTRKAIEESRNLLKKIGGGRDSAEGRMQSAESVESREDNAEREMAGRDE